MIWTAVCSGHGYQALRGKPSRQHEGQRPSRTVSGVWRSRRGSRAEGIRLRGELAFLIFDFGILESETLRTPSVQRLGSGW